MSITITSVPDYLTREQYLSLIRGVGFDVDDVIELRFAADGVHALVRARMNEHREPDPNGMPWLDRTPSAQTQIPGTEAALAGGGYCKHRVFVPVRLDDEDRRTTRIRTVEG